MTDYERKADHYAAMHLLGILSLPVFGAIVGGYILYWSHPILGALLAALGVAGLVKLSQFAGELGEQNARKHRGGRR